MGWIQTEKERFETESSTEREKGQLPDCKPSQTSVGNCKTVSAYGYYMQGFLFMGLSSVMGV